MSRLPATETRRGFTLGELMLALLIVAMALLGLVAQQIYALRAQGKVSLRQRAGVAAASRMAELQNQLAEDFSPRLIAREPVYGNDGLEFAAAITPVPDLDNLLEITGTVYWQDAQGMQQVQLRTRCLRP